MIPEMKIIFLFLMWLLLLSCSDNSTQSTQPDNDIPENAEFKITILYDNFANESGTHSDWGFACLVETADDTILFDTGANSGTLLHNFEFMEIDLNRIETILISHNHSDHIGGLMDLLNQRHEVTVFLPSSVSPAYVENVQNTGAEVFLGCDSLFSCNKMCSTGEISGESNDIIEQSLILDTNKGLIIIAGCSHPGIIDLLTRAKTILHKNIYMVLGGFHMPYWPDEDIMNIIDQFQQLEVEYCGATHCTGDRAIQLFSQAYGEKFISMGTGKIIAVTEEE